MLYIALYLAAKHLQPVVNVFTVTGSDSKNFIIGISFHCKIFSRFREIPSLAPTLVTVSALLSLLGRLPSTPWTVWTLDTGSATFGRSGPRSPIILLPCRNFDNGYTFCVTMTSNQYIWWPCVLTHEIKSHTYNIHWLQTQTILN